MLELKDVSHIYGNGTRALDGVSLEVAKESLRLAAQKLPVRTTFVVRRDYVEAAA